MRKREIEVCQGISFHPLFSRIIADDKTGPSSRLGITIEVVSRSRLSKITASLLTGPPPLLFLSPLIRIAPADGRCAISLVRKFIARLWLIRGENVFTSEIQRRCNHGRMRSSVFSRWTDIFLSIDSIRFDSIRPFEIVANFTRVIFLRRYYYSRRSIENSLIIDLFYWCYFFI